MEPKFINQYQVTLERYQYWARHPVGKKAVHNRRLGIRLRIALICCGLLLILCGVLTQERIMPILGIFGILMGLARLFFLPNIILKKQYALILKSQNSDTWVEQIVFSDEIVCESGNASFRYACSDILSVTEDSDYFYLFYNEDMVLRIYKPGFVLGTSDDFRIFCKELVKK